VTSKSASAKPSPRIIKFVDALPLASGMRVLEIGCGPGVAAREICRRIGEGYVLAIDRSHKAIELAKAGSPDEIATGRLKYICQAIENFELPNGMCQFDIAFAMRVGALDGRHPAAGKEALIRIQRALRPGGRLFMDAGDPLSEVALNS
jgi:SAM-dependent methyltransferase